MNAEFSKREINAALTVLKGGLGMPYAYGMYEQKGGLEEYKDFEKAMSAAWAQQAQPQQPENTVDLNAGAPEPTKTQPVVVDAASAQAAELPKGEPVAPTPNFKNIAMAAVVRGETRILPILVGGKNPIIKWAHLPIHDVSPTEWQGLYTKWIEELAAAYPNANACTVARADEYLYIDEDKSDEFRAGFEAYAGESFPRTHTTSARPNRRQSGWKQTEYSRKMLWNIVQGKTKDQMFSIRFHNLYVLAEGSVHPKGSVYTAVDNSPLMPIPDKLVDYILSLVVNVTFERGQRVELNEDGTQKEGGNWFESFSLDEPFVHGNIDNTVKDFIWYYIKHQNIGDGPQLWETIEEKFKQNGCFEPDGETLFNWNRDQIRKKCFDKAKTITTGEQDRKAEEQKALTEGTEIGERAAAAFAAIPTDQIITTPQEWPTVQQKASLLNQITGSNFINIVSTAETQAERAKKQKEAVKELDAWLEGNSELTTEAIVERVRLLDDMTYEVRRKKIAKKSELRTEYFDKEREKVAEQQGHAEEINDVVALISDVQPWGDPVNLRDLLTETENVFKQYIHFKRPEDSTTAALWVGQTYTVDFQSEFPYLGVRSPLEGCGKTSVLDLLAEMCNRTLKAGNLSTSAAFRIMDQFHPCLIIDEADTFINIQPDFVGILNLGHKKDGGHIFRVLGEGHDKLTPFAVWGPKAYGMIGTAPATFASRSIPTILERAVKSDGLTSFPKTPKGKEALKNRLRVIAQKWKRWVTDNSTVIANHEPDMTEFENRTSDNWYPLMRIAELAGDDWTRKALKASGILDPYAKPDTLRLLLRDVQNIFHTRKVESLTPSILVSDLKSQVTGWDEIGKNDKPLTPAKLASMLENFGVRSRKTDGLRVYRLSDLQTVFERFLDEGPTETELGPMSPANQGQNTVSLGAANDAKHLTK